MSIRIRTVKGVRVALCAVESDPIPGDVYLDDADHYALAAKFARDWYGRGFDVSYPAEWAVMDTQKVRDAVEEHARWDAARKGGPGDGKMPSLRFCLIPSTPQH